MDMWTSKIVEFGTIPIHARYSSKYIPRKSLFGADFGLTVRYFFQNEAGVVVIINGERYRSIISNLWPKMDDMDTNNMWFQQDGATCHTPHATMDILHERFEDIVISRGGDVNWPSRSCDLRLLPSYLKSQIYMNKSQIIDALKVNIKNAI